MLCLEQAEGTLTKNKIEKNRFNGVTMQQAAGTAFVENVIASSGLCGVLCERGSGGRFEMNEMIENGSANIRLHPACTPVFEKNNIIGCQKLGVLVEGASARFSKNTIQQNEEAGVVIGREVHQPL